MPQHTMTGQCIDEHIHHLACILNIFYRTLDRGAGEIYTFISYS